MDFGTAGQVNETRDRVSEGLHKVLERANARFEASDLAATCTASGDARREYLSCDQLRQLTSPVWDGNLMDQRTRDHLVKAGLVDRALGWNFLTSKGIEFCVTLGILRN